MKRVMCIYLPRWPLQNLRHHRPELRDRPVVIVRRQASGAQVVLGCPRAAQAGVQPGLSLAEAQALQRQLFVQDEDPEGDRRALERLAEWAQRYSPIVGLAEDSLLLDITGCAACFHGEDRLAQRAARELRGQGWHAHLALAGTLGAAWAVAHALVSPRPRIRGKGVEGEELATASPPSPPYSGERSTGLFHIVPSADTEKVLGPLPVAALRLPEEAADKLAALGIEQIAQLASLPRSSIPGRFGPLVLQRLDQALGQVPELFVPHRPLPDVQAGCSFEYPTDRRVVLDHALDKLLERIEATLRVRNRGARSLECWFHHEAAAPLRLDVDLFRPSRSARHLGKLLRARFEQVQIAEPVCRLSLRVPAVELLPEHQFELFEDDASRLEELGDLIDRLASRFGRETVTFARLVDDCQPEYACRFEPALSPVKKGTGPLGLLQNQVENQGAERSCPLFHGAPTTLAGHRPLQVWPSPMPIHVLAAFPAGIPLKFLWRGQEYTVRQAWGPERIETGWWRGRDVQRDYYTVETHLGTRLWLFRRQQDMRWFLHGCFD